MARKTAADVHLELAVHQKEMSERWKTAFNKFNEIDLNIKGVKLGGTWKMPKIIGKL